VNLLLELLYLMLNTEIKDPMMVFSHSRVSLVLFSTLAALRLRARKERVGVISLSTMLLSNGLSCMLRAAKKQESLVSTLYMSNNHLPSLILNSNCWYSRLRSRCYILHKYNHCNISFYNEKIMAITNNCVCLPCCQHG